MSGKYTKKGSVKKLPVIIGLIAIIISPTLYLTLYQSSDNSNSTNAVTTQVFLTDSVSDQDEVAESTATEADPISAYEAVLKEYIAASDNPYEDSPYYYHFHASPYLYYSYCDIDHNGINELLIGRPDSVLDVYAFDGENAVWVINKFFFGMQTELTVMETGEMYIETQNAGDAGAFFMLQLADDGFSTETVFSYEYIYREGVPPYQGTNGSEQVFLTEEEFLTQLSAYTQRSDITWIQFTGTSENSTEAYQKILDEYTAACADQNYLNVRDQYPNINNDGMYYYHAFGAVDLFYAYYDIDHNGVDELVIGTGSIWDVYAYDGYKAVKLVDETALGGGRANLTIMDSGELYISGSSGADDSSCYMLRMADDGFSTELVFYFTFTYNEYGSSYQGMIGNEHILLSEEEFEAKMSDYTEVTELPWSILAETPMTSSKAYQLILDEYTAALADVFAGEKLDSVRYPHAKVDTTYQENDSSGIHLACSFYDVDHNGTDELLIGFAQEYGGLFADFENMRILDVYTFDGTQALQLIDEPYWVDTCKLIVTEDGELYFSDDRMDGGKIISMYIGADGYSPKENYSYHTRLENNQMIYYNNAESLVESELTFQSSPYYTADNIEWTGFAYHSDFWEE